jgi:hypothetical protein
VAAEIVAVLVSRECVHTPLLLPSQPLQRTLALTVWGVFYSGNMISALLAFVLVGKSDQQIIKE